MSYEDELVQRLQREGGQVRSEMARRAHLLKMGGAGALMALCFGLFACGILGGRQRVEQARAVGASARSEPGRRVDLQTAGKRLAAVSAPELAALVAGSASGIYFLYLLMRLRRIG